MADMIQIKGLNKYFGDLHVLKDVNLNVKEGEKLVIIGPSGSGKSTLIRCVDFLEEPTTGEVVIDGTVLTKKNHLEMARKYSSMVFQQFNLYPNMTVLGNLTLAPIKLQRKSKEEANKIAMAALERVGLANKAGEYPQNRWPAAARRHRPRPLHQAAHHPLRRAHLRSGPRDGPGGPRRYDRAGAGEHHHDVRHA